MEPNYRLEKSIEIPEFGEIQILGRKTTNRDSLELVFTFIPTTSKTDKVEFLFTWDGNGRYRFFDRSKTSIIEEPFDGCGLA